MTTLPGLPDPDSVAVARRGQRAIVTTNLRDFRPLHMERITPGSPGHAGFVFVPTTYRRSKADIGRLVAALESKLAAHSGDLDLADAETWI